jgi:hypothetical protein
VACQRPTEVGCQRRWIPSRVRCLGGGLRSAIVLAKGTSITRSLMATLWWLSLSLGEGRGLFLPGISPRPSPDGLGLPPGIPGRARTSQHEGSRQQCMGTPGLNRGRGFPEKGVLGESLATDFRVSEQILLLFAAWWRGFVGPCCSRLAAPLIGRTSSHAHFPIAFPPWRKPAAAFFGDVRWTGLFAACHWRCRCSSRQTSAVNRSADRSMNYGFVKASQEL